MPADIASLSSAVPRNVPVERVTAFGGHIYVKYNSPRGAISTARNGKLGSLSILLPPRRRRAPAVFCLSQVN